MLSLHVLSQTTDPKVTADLERTYTILRSMQTRLNRAVVQGLGDTRIIPDATVSRPKRDKITMGFLGDVDVTRWPKAEYDWWKTAWRFAVHHTDVFGPAADFPLGEQLIDPRKLPTIKESVVPLTRGIGTLAAMLGKPVSGGEDDDEKPKKPLIGRASLIVSLIAAIGVGVWYVYTRRRTEVLPP